MTVLSLIISVTLFTPVQAKGNEPIVFTYNNNVYEFPDEETFQYFKENEMNNDGIMLAATHNVYTTVYNVPKYKVWVGYHPLTPNWSKASSYTLSSGRSYTINGSYTYNGATFGITVTNSVGSTVTYPANSSKYSKLGVRADVKLIRTKVDVYDTNTYMNTYYVNSTYVSNYYIATVYQ